MRSTVRVAWAGAALSCLWVTLGLGADGELARARELADTQARYDEGERVYRRLIDEADPSARPGLAAELAAMYERLGEIDAAVEMYELAVAQGSFPKPLGRRLESRLQRCRRQRASLVRFPVSVEAQTEIRQVEALLKARQWAAFRTLGNLVERFTGTFLQRGPGQYLGIREWARSTLDALPVEGRAAYVAFSNKRWRDALADGSIDALRQFVKDHPAAVVSGPALLAWADTLADQGKLARALGLIGRSEVAGKEAGARRERWERLLGRAGTISSAGRPARGWAGSQVDQASGAVPARVLTRPEDGPARLGWVGSQVDQASGAVPARVLPRPEDGPARLGRAGGAVIKRDPAEEPDALGLAASGGCLFVRRPFRVDAYDTAGGRWLWCYRPDDPADRVDVGREVYRKSNRPKDPWTGAADRPAITLCPAGVLIVETYHRGDVEYVYSVVTCLHPQTGTVRWRLDADPTFERLRVCSDPICSGGKVLFTASSRGEYPEFWLCAVDAADGALLWRKRIATGATPTRCVGRGVLYGGRSGPTLTHDGETVYYATHMGAVVAVDRDLGEPLWAVSYPRVARFGPITTAPLTLLERRTEPIRITPHRLVLLPRDINALLVIDRTRGKLQRTIRSLDLRELIDATDDRAVVTTLSGEVRAYRLNDGSLIWSWPLARSGSGAVRIGDELAVWHGQKLTRLEAASGSVLGEYARGEFGELRRVGPDEQWVAIGRDHIRLLDGEPGLIDTPPPSPVIARSRRSSSQGGWRHHAFMPARGAMARLVRAGGSVSLIVADRSGLAAYAPAEDYARHWWRAFDGGRSVWAASVVETHAPGTGSERDSPETRSIVAVSDDRETLRLIEPVTGDVLAAGRVDSVLPIRTLYAVGEHVWVVGTSTIAGVRAGAEGHQDELETTWQLDVAPRVFEAIFPGDPVTSVFVQPGGGKPGRLMRIESATGRVEHSFVIAAPLPGESGYRQQDGPDRFAVRRLTYTQEQLLSDGRACRIAANAGEIRLYPSPVRVLDRQGRFAIVEITDYWGIVELATGEVTLMSPFETANDASPLSGEQRMLLDWLRTHPKHNRIEELGFSFDASGLRFARDSCLLAFPEERLSCGFLVDTSDRRIALGDIRPRHIDVVDGWAVVSGERGTLILRDDPGPPPASQPSTGPGKDAADLFAPPPVAPSPTAGLVLDGDLSDWPDDAWQAMTAERHTWPGASQGDAPGRSASMSSTKAAFQWATDDAAVWLAVRVEDDTLAASSAATTARGDRVDVMLMGRQWAQPPLDPHRTPPVPATISMSLADNVPIAYIRTPGYPLMMARPAGMEASFEHWLRRRYAQRPQVAEDVVLAAERNFGQTLYELRIDRRFFKAGEPRGFDIRVEDDDGSGVHRRLQWCGGLTDPAVYPLAPFPPTR